MAMISTALVRASPREEWNSTGDCEQDDQGDALLGSIPYTRPSGDRARFVHGIPNGVSEPKPHIRGLSRGVGHAPDRAPRPPAVKSVCTSGQREPVADTQQTAIFQKAASSAADRSCSSQCIAWPAPA
jgi:hypothetical protein